MRRVVGALVVAVGCHGGGPPATRTAIGSVPAAIGSPAPADLGPCPPRFAGAVAGPLTQPVDGDLAGVAPSPSDSRLVAAWTTQHLFVSRDSGTSWHRVLDGEGELLTATFDCHGRALAVRAVGGLGVRDGARELWRPLPGIALDRPPYNPDIDEDHHRPRLVGGGRSIAVFGPAAGKEKERGQRVAISADVGATWRHVDLHGYGGVASRAAWRGSALRIATPWHEEASGREGIELMTVDASGARTTAIPTYLGDVALDGDALLMACDVDGALGMCGWEAGEWFEAPAPPVFTSGYFEVIDGPVDLIAGDDVVVPMDADGVGEAIRWHDRSVEAADLAGRVWGVAHASSHGGRLVRGDDRTGATLEPAPGPGPGGVAEGVPDPCPAHFVGAVPGPLAQPSTQSIEGVRTSYRDARDVVAWTHDHVFVSRDAGRSWRRILDGAGDVLGADLDCHGRVLVLRRMAGLGVRDGDRERWRPFVDLGLVRPVADDHHGSWRLIGGGPAIAVLGVGPPGASEKPELVMISRDVGLTWQRVDVPDHLSQTASGWDETTLRLAVPYVHDRGLVEVIVTAAGVRETTLGAETDNVVVAGDAVYATASFLDAGCPGALPADVCVWRGGARTLVRAPAHPPSRYLLDGPVAALIVDSKDVYPLRPDGLGPPRRWTGHSLHAVDLAGRLWGTAWSADGDRLLRQ